MNIRNIPVKLCVLLSCAALASACSDDEAPAMKPTLPADGGALVKSITHMGNVPPSYDWAFTYSSDRLVKAEGTSRNPSTSIDMHYSYTSSLKYGPKSVNISNSGNEKIEVVLNTSGLIEKMTVNKNTYEFYYRDLRLIGWSKTIFEESFGNPTLYTASATIEYDDGDLSRIVYTENNLQQEILTFTPSSITNRNGLLPELASKELGCLGFEQLYYAGLFGRPTIHHVQALSVEYPLNETENFTANFEYSTRGGNTVLCNYHYKGQPASVSYQY